MQKLNVGSGPFHVAGWVNTDTRVHPEAAPDVISLIPFPFKSEAFDMVYLGHVLEHVPWNDIPDFLTEVKRVCKPGARVMVVGPDVLKGLDWYRNERMDLAMWRALGEDGAAWPPNNDTPGGRHEWNCYAERVMMALGNAGFGGVREHDVGGISEDWPLVSRIGWQLAVGAHA